MNLTKFSKKAASVGFVVAVCLSASILLPGLGGFGMWEPHEVKRADVASSFLADTPVVGNASQPLQLEERLVALSWSLTSRSELTARLPIALVALLTVVAMFVLLLPIADVRVAFYAAIALASAPILLFHGRQLTSHMPLLFGGVLSIGGLALAAYGKKRKGVAAGIAAAVAGMVLGWLSAGVLIGVFIPSFTVFVALALNGDLRAESDSPSRSPQLVAIVTGVLSIAALGAFLTVFLFSEQDLPLLTGGIANAPSKHKSFEFVFEQLAYGWFPWSAFIPVAVLGFFTAWRSKGGTHSKLLAIAMSGILVGSVVQAFFVNLHGVLPCFLAFPMAIGVALAISDMENRTEPALLGALVILALLVIMVRDFAQRPETLLMGYAFENIPLPAKDFSLVVSAAIASAPVFLFVLFLGFAGRFSKDAAGWRAWRVPLFAFVCAAFFGGYIAHVLVPDLSQKLSSKSVLESYNRFKKGAEPLGVYGKGNRTMDATSLNRQETLAWLQKEERVFVLFPPSRLADINREFWKITGRHVLVLDNENKKFLLATSKLHSKEKNQNPIAPFVQKDRFVPGPSHLEEVNFEDKATLLGWDIVSETGSPELIRGKEAIITTYWRCDGKMKRNNEIFMHIDGPGGRLHGDHDPLENFYPTTKWEVGDYLKDVHKLTVPLYQKPGKYSVRLGLYKGSTRLKIENHPQAKKNAVWIAKVEVK
jgi:4-amino-4-deoxy-L-arabinose transferase-like glycosyltransferase